MCYSHVLLLLLSLDFWCRRKCGRNVNLHNITHEYMYNIYNIGINFSYLYNICGWRWKWYCAPFYEMSNKRKSSCPPAHDCILDSRRGKHPIHCIVHTRVHKWILCQIANHIVFHILLLYDTMTFLLLSQSCLPDISLHSLFATEEHLVRISRWLMVWIYKKMVSEFYFMKK